LSFDGISIKKFNVMASRQIVYGKSFYNMTIALKREIDA
jgi:hypothetical protein